MKRALSLAARGRRLTAEMRRHQAHALVRNPAKKASDGLSEPMRALYEALSIKGARRAKMLAHGVPWLLVESLEDYEHRGIARELARTADVDAAIRAVERKEKGWLAAWAARIDGSMVPGEDGVQAPSTLFFGPPRIVRDTWLIHFTNFHDAITREGFGRGVSDPHRLGLTKRVPADEKSQPGYVFAYLPEDVRRFAYRLDESPKYGRWAVAFRADAVVARHNTDREDQAIAWGPDARDIVVLRVADMKPCVEMGGSEKCFPGFPEAVAFLDSRTARQNPARRR